MGGLQSYATDVGAYNATSVIPHWQAAQVLSSLGDDFVDVLTGNFGALAPPPPVATYITGPSLKSCYVNTGQMVAEDIATSSLTRFLIGGGLDADISYALNQAANALDPGIIAFYQGVIDAPNYVAEGDAFLQSIRPYTITGVPVAYPPPLHSVTISDPPTLQFTPLAPPPNIQNITIIPPNASVNTGDVLVDVVVNSLTNSFVGAGVTVASTLANTGINLSNDVVHTGIQIGNSLQGAGTTIGNSVQNAGVAAANAVEKAAVDVLNDAAHAGVTAVNTLENAGVEAANAIEQTALTAVQATSQGISVAVETELNFVYNNTYSGLQQAVTNGLTGTSGGYFAQSGGEFNPENWSPPGQGGCFPGNSLVMLDDGSFVEMFQLETGMKVLAINGRGEPIFSEVFTWILREPDAEDVFLELETESGKSIRLSKQHYIHVTQGTWKDTHLISAQEVQVGQCVWVDSKTSKVTRISEIVEKGVFSPVTVEGSIVVDSVLASCVTTYEDIIGSGFPTLYITKRAPPMMAHHFILKWAYLLGGWRGMRIMDFFHKPLYALAGRAPPK